MIAEAAKACGAIIVSSRDNLVGMSAQQCLGYTAWGNAMGLEPLNGTTRIVSARVDGQWQGL